jgi:hypothetical protein
MISALVIFYVGSIGLLLRFGRANHRSAERAIGGVVKQIVSLGTFAAVVMALWLGVERAMPADAGGKPLRERMKDVGTVTGRAMDADHNFLPTYVVVVFVVSRDDESPTRQRTFFDPVTPTRRDYGSAEPGSFELRLLPGQYLVNAIRSMGALSGQSELARLKATAIPVSIATGDFKTINLTISSGP